MPGGPSTQRARFQPVSLSSIWSNLVSHLTPPSHPSTTSQSALDSGLTHTDGFYGPDSSFGAEKDDTHPLQLLKPNAHPSRLRRLQSRKKAKSSGANSTSRYGDDDDPLAANHEPVSHLVVDNNFEHFTPPPPKSDSGTGATPQGMGLPDDSVQRHSTLGRSEDADADDGEKTPTRVGGGTRSEASRLDTARTFVQKAPGYELLVERAWPIVRHFFDSSFPEPAKERSFQKESWFNQKAGAMLSSAYMLIAWALTVGLMPLPLTKFNWWAYFGLAGILMFPIPALVIFDFPRRHNRIWQIWLLGATWCLSDVLVGEMYACGFFSKDHNTCGTRNFLNFFGFAYGFPTLAMLALKQSRTAAAFGASQWLILVGVLLVHQGHAPRLFYRNMVSFALFHAFLIGTSFLKERSDRQMFALRQQLKIQYRATQSAQVMERRASDSKKRFVSYIFHEVRVPLNTALLAVQNLEGENVFRGLGGDQSEMVHGLMGSLTMMEKVLNDVLSFNRMESGKFTQARKPFEFHKSIQLVALSHRMQAQMAGIDLIVDLDKDIDKIGGMFIGDEMRLRQVASNLVSNSIKFTDKGSVRVVTKLLYPRLEPTPATEIDDPLRQAAINLQHAQQMEEAERMARLATEGSTSTVVSGDLEKGSIKAESRRMSRDSAFAAGVKEKHEEEKRPVLKAVVRVEIHDTGVGLRTSDVIDNRLFSPYVQTEIGRRQGGKGSGLGLALVRQIVKLSNGRLGVESQFGKGSMFWFELPYSLPPPPKNRSKELHVPTTSHFGPGSGGGSGTGSKTSGMATPGPMATPRLGMIEEVSTPLEGRPGMVTTESTMPLLGESGSRRRSSILVNEGVITATFPPVEGLPGDSPSSDILPPLEPRDPFRAESTGRPSSDSDTPKVEVEHAEKAVAQRPPPMPPAESPLCTLVVDDDKLTRMLMSRMLTRLGHQVTTAENGKIALDMIRDSFLAKPNAPRFDVVFLDNQMPLMSGVEVAREVRDMECPLFIVGCTGNALREDQEEYISAGADEIIPKPIHQKSVEEMIKLARRRTRGETVPRERDMGY